MGCPDWPNRLDKKEVKEVNLFNKLVNLYEMTCTWYTYQDIDYNTFYVLLRSVVFQRRSVLWCQTFPVYVISGFQSTGTFRLIFRVATCRFKSFFLSVNLFLPLLFGFLPFPRTLLQSLPTPSFSRRGWGWGVGVWFWIAEKTHLSITPWSLNWNSRNNSFDLVLDPFSFSKFHEDPLQTTFNTNYLFCVVQLSQSSETFTKVILFGPNPSGSTPSLPHTVRNLHLSCITSNSPHPSPLHRKIPHSVLPSIFPVWPFGPDCHRPQLDFFKECYLTDIWFMSVSLVQKVTTQGRVRS